eukprot:8329_1
MRFIMCILRCLLMCGILWKEHALFVGSLLSNWYQNSIRNIWVRTDPVIIKCSNAQHIILNTCQTIGTIDRSFESQRGDENSTAEMRFPIFAMIKWYFCIIYF